MGAEIRPTYSSSRGLPPHRSLNLRVAEKGPPEPLMLTRVGVPQGHMPPAVATHTWKSAICQLSSCCLGPEAQGMSPRGCQAGWAPCGGWVANDSWVDRHRTARPMGVRVGDAEGLRAVPAPRPRS